MATLETFPAELKRLILNNISDVQSIQNLVHASPDYHAVYISAQPEIFTSVTLQELSCRGIDISKTEPLVEFIYDGEKLYAPKRLGGYLYPTWEQIASALRQLRRHEIGLARPRPAGAKVVLSVDQCLGLLRLAAIVWIPAEVHFRKPCDLPIWKSYGGKGMTEITQKRLEHVEALVVQCPHGATGYHMLYLDDVREGYEQLDIRPRPRYYHVRAFWPRKYRWDNWWQR